jgi:hypothetical protein
VKSYLGSREIGEVFRLENFLGSVDYIFKRAFRGKS